MEKIALITGGNSGIGFATANSFKENGYEVYISGRNPDKVRRVADELHVKPLIADMADLKAVQRLASNFDEKGLDVLVNNAGMPQYFPIDAITEEKFAEIFNVNVRGALFLIRYLIPALEKRNGNIINVSSIRATCGAANLCLYCGTKGALDAITRSLAVELAAKGIRVNAVAPGVVDTPIFFKVGETQGDINAHKAKREACIPLGRFANPEEIASVIIAQAEATYVTGSVWSIDGGITAG